MKALRIIPILILILFTSCNKDDKDDMRHLLEGHWHAYDFKPDASSSIVASLGAKEAISKLANENCDLIEFTFDAGGNVFARDGLRFITVLSVDEGVEFECATQFDDKSGIFNFDSKKLTLDYEQGKLQYEASVDGDYLTIKSDDILFNDKRVSGELLFLRELQE